MQHARTLTCSGDCVRVHLASTDGWCAVAIDDFRLMASITHAHTGVQYRPKLRLLPFLWVFFRCALILPRAAIAISVSRIPGSRPFSPRRPPSPVAGFRDDRKLVKQIHPDWSDQMEFMVYLAPWIVFSIVRNGAWSVHTVSVLRQLLKAFTFSPSTYVGLYIAHLGAFWRS